MKLIPGKGDEQDTLKDKTIFVYDTEQFPFYPGSPATLLPLFTCFNISPILPAVPR